MRPALFALTLLVACGGDSSGPSKAVLQGSATDPVGDAIAAADLVRAAIRVADDTLYLSASFVQADFTNEDLSVLFYVDIDESGVTGDLGFDPALGSDYLLSFYKDYPEVGISHWEGGWVEKFVLQTGGVGHDSTATARIPLSLLGGDDGRLRFKVQAFWWNGLTYDEADVLTAPGMPAIVVK